MYRQLPAHETQTPAHITLATSKQQNLFAPEALPPDPMPWELAADRDQLVAQVVFNRPLDSVYSYAVPNTLRDSIAAGQRVKVPFGRGDRLTIGYCVGLGKPETLRPLKAVASVVDSEPLLPAKMLELTRWIADQYLCPWGQVLDIVIPGGVKKQAGTRLVNFYRPTPEARALLDKERSQSRGGEASETGSNEAHKLSEKQRAVIELLCSSPEPLRLEEITETVGCKEGPIAALRKKGLVATLQQRSENYRPEFGPVATQPDLVLNPEQQQALETIQAVLRAGEHRTVLLHGVTGSGKTEVYIQAIREVVSYGRQAIVLVPEISLTPQTIRRFRQRFESVAVLHSHLTDAERHWHWQQIARGDVQVVVGARSAVFAPTLHLGMIVIDEEHETSFKQESVPRYHAREVARRRAEMERVPLVLGSATPTLESWVRVQEKQDVLISLPKRVERLPLPPVVVVDIRNDPYCSQGAAIGRALGTAMRTALENDGQVILFLNLRGFSPVLWCKACGESVKCPHCDITLNWHKDRRVALCHSCNYEGPAIANCPACGHAGMRYLGIGTQRLEQEVRSKFPKYKTIRMDSDSMRKHGSHDVALEAFHRGEVQILLGTQMIAKGLDFPNVTLVGVVNADTILNQPDLRASERTFQLISQVAGRTGRSHKGGRVFVQTSSPGEPSILRASEHDYAGFVRDELEHRRQMRSPPFVRLARVVLRGPDEAAVREQAQAMASLLREAVEWLRADMRVLGPAPAPVAKLKGHYRYHFQLSSPSDGEIGRVWRDVAGRMPKSNRVEYVVDIDPINMR